MSSVAPWQQQFLHKHRLPDTYLDGARQYFEPLASLLAHRRRGHDSTLRVALNGCQGSGKSTLGDYLCECLSQEHKLSAVALSLDDFYLTFAERQVLGEDTHPLLKTRGVPGTHDVRLLRKVLDALSHRSLEPNLEPGDALVKIPRFDKSADDRASPETWSTAEAPLDVIVLEGWCLGARSESADALCEPINVLERTEDAHAYWRAFSNQQLMDDYEPLYAELDIWVMLAAPGFEHVLRWRSEQEQKLRESSAGKGQGLMNADALSRFVQHFERYTRQCLRDMPKQVDVLFELDSERNIVASRGLGSPV